MDWALPEVVVLALAVLPDPALARGQVVDRSNPEEERIRAGVCNQFGREARSPEEPDTGNPVGDNPEWGKDNRVAVRTDSQAEPGMPPRVARDTQEVRDTDTRAESVARSHRRRVAGGDAQRVVEWEQAAAGVVEQVERLRATGTARHRLLRAGRSRRRWAADWVQRVTEALTAAWLRPLATKRRAWTEQCRRAKGRRLAFSTARPLRISCISPLARATSRGFATASCTAGRWPERSRPSSAPTCFVARDWAIDTGVRGRLSLRS